MASTIKLKRSSTSSDTPAASDLEVGELAVNTADGKLFTKHTDKSIKEVAGDIERGVLNVKNAGTQSEVRLFCESANAHYAGLKAPAHADFAGNVTSTLPSVTGTLIGTANADAPATTTSSGDADHVLINDGGVLKKIDPSDLGIGSGGGSYANSDVDTHLNTSTASANEVLSWTGSDYDWIAQSGGGGGGATNLTGLSDVNISSVQNNDLLMYNATASEWQNTNLGLTIDPSISSFAGTGTNILAGDTVTAVVVPSSGSYDLVSYFAEVRNAANDSTVITNSNINQSGNTFTFTAPSVGNYIFRVKAQDFGDLQSEYVNQSFSVVVPTGYRYFRITGTGATVAIAIHDLQFFTGANQTGTEYPASVGHMTSATAPSPLVATSSGTYLNSSYYGGWKAFDSSTAASFNSAFANLGQTYDPWYIQLDTGQSSDTVLSAKIRVNQYYHGGAHTLTLSGSVDGTNFTDVASYSKPSSGGTYYNIG